MWHSLLFLRPDRFGGCWRADPAVETRLRRNPMAYWRMVAAACACPRMDTPAVRRVLAPLILQPARDGVPLSQDHAKRFSRRTTLPTPSATAKSSKQTASSGYVENLYGHGSADCYSI